MRGLLVMGIPYQHAPEVSIVRTDTCMDGMVLIPAGSFTMGDNLDGDSDAVPIGVTVSAFYMDTNLVSYSHASASVSPHYLHKGGSMRGLLVMGIPYQHAPEVSIVRTDTCT
jgi:hypothetical protein